MSAKVEAVPQLARHVVEDRCCEHAIGCLYQSSFPMAVDKMSLTLEPTDAR